MSSGKRRGAMGDGQSSNEVKSEKREGRREQGFVHRKKTNRERIAIADDTDFTESFEEM